MINKLKWAGSQGEGDSSGSMFFELEGQPFEIKLQSFHDFNVLSSAFNACAEAGFDQARSLIKMNIMSMLSKSSPQS